MFSPYICIFSSLIENSHILIILLNPLNHHRHLLVDQKVLFIYFVFIFYIYVGVTIAETTVSRSSNPLVRSETHGTAIDIMNDIMGGGEAADDNATLAAPAVPVSISLLCDTLISNPCVRDVLLLCSLNVARVRPMRRVCHRKSLNVSRNMTHRQHPL